MPSAADSLDRALCVSYLFQLPEMSDATECGEAAVYDRFSLPTSNYMCTSIYLRFLSFVALVSLPSLLQSSEARAHASCGPVSVLMLGARGKAFVDCWSPTDGFVGGGDWLEQGSVFWSAWVVGWPAHLGISAPGYLSMGSGGFLLSLL